MFFIFVIPTVVGVTVRRMLPPALGGLPGAGTPFISIAFLGVSLVTAGDGEGEREDPYWGPSLFQDLWRLGTSGAGTFQPRLPKIKKMSFVYFKEGQGGGY